MTDKDFVLSVYPTAEVDDSRDMFHMGRVKLYAIYLAGATPREVLSGMWATTEFEAWKGVADSIRYDMLRKFEQ